MKTVFFALSLASQLAAATPPATEASFNRPSYKEVITRAPNSIKYTFNNAFAEGTLVPWVSVLAGSLVTYYYDEEWLLEVQRWGRNAGIGNKERTRTMIKLGDITVFRGPTDTGSWLYFIGDGWTNFFIVGGLLSYGELKDNNRALATSLQMVHGMAISTLFNQTLKRSTGRESPNERTEKRGKWRPFPSFKAYGEKTARYDAVPSGHVMTSTMSLTILLTNYPEKRYWILPTGVTLISLLGFQMMNNGVHWASDYPLAIAMGVFFGHMVTPLWRNDLEENKKAETTSLFLPWVEEDVAGVKWLYRF